jgi:hypothetical protein
MVEYSVVGDTIGVASDEYTLSSPGPVVEAELLVWERSIASFLALVMRLILIFFTPDVIFSMSSAEVLPEDAAVGPDDCVEGRAALALCGGTVTFLAALGVLGVLGGCLRVAAAGLAFFIARLLALWERPDISGRAALCEDPGCTLLWSPAGWLGGGISSVGLTIADTPLSRLLVRLAVLEAVAGAPRFACPTVSVTESFIPFELFLTLSGDTVDVATVWRLFLDNSSSPIGKSTALGFRPRSAMRDDDRSGVEGTDMEPPVNDVWRACRARVASAFRSSGLQLSVWRSLGISIFDSS